MRKSAWLDVWIIAVSQIISGSGAYLALTTLILTLQDTGATGLAVAGVTVAASLPVVALAPVTGRLADRFDSRLLMVVAGVVQIAGCLLLSFAGSTVLRIACVLLIYSGTALGLPVRAALLPVMVTEEDLPRAGAINQSATVIGSMFGPPIAGFAYHAVGSAPGTLRWAAVGFLATVVGGLLVRTRRGTRMGEEHPAAAGAARPPMDRLLKVVFIGLAAVVGAISAVDVVAVFFVRETLESSAQTYGLIMATWPIGMVAGAWGQAKLAEKAPDARLSGWLFGSLAITATGVVLLAAVGSAPWMVPIWLAGGLLNGAANVLVTTLVARRSPVANRGHVAAIMQAAVQASLLAGYLFAGLALTANLTPRMIILGCGVIAVVTVAFISPWVRAAARSSELVTSPVLGDRVPQPQE
ncbi:MFS family permease [Hamadaea flava]|uniref:MFS transporter n=1 Tax=Hamadaea flava TaxID=1742688 RepID=A0ABV8LEQ7_9ACTN|nr:MFS transporter [Hamadaea flava]MCP2325848.1 MFS family permease [Hamadaea flava]